MKPAKQNFSKRSDMLRIRTGISAGNITVYGSPGCPWCNKQIEYFESKNIAFEFVDCTQEKCPDIVKGYPTTVISGFQEL